MTNIEFFLNRVLSKVWILKEVPSEKCNSEELNTFSLHKKVPVLIDHNI